MFLVKLDIHTLPSPLLWGRHADEGHQILVVGCLRQWELVQAFTALVQVIKDFWSCFQQWLVSLRRSLYWGYFVWWFRSHVCLVRSLLKELWYKCPVFDQLRCHISVRMYTRGQHDSPEPAGKQLSALPFSISHLRYKLMGEFQSKSFAANQNAFPAS